MIGTAAATSPPRCRTDGAGGFLPGVPLGCLGMTGPRSRLRPRPLRQRMRDESRGRVKLVGQPHAGIQRRPQRRVPAPKGPVIELLMDATTGSITLRVLAVRL